MARYLLDSSVLVRMVRTDGDKERDWFRQARVERHELGVCLLVTTELYRGAHPLERQELERLLGTLTYWPTERVDGVRAGSTRYDLARGGFQVSLPDSHIAAVAARVGATVVTRNRKDFERLGAALLDPSAP
jgi:predicted nucleic acid-binding protein